MGHTALVSGVVRLVGVQRTVQKNGNVKSEPKYLACKESPVRAFYFWILSCSSITLLALRCADFFAFFVSESPAVSCVQHSFMHLAMQIRTSRRTSHAALPVLCSQETSSQRPCVMRVSGILSRCEHKLTFWGWPQIDIPKRYRKLIFLSVTNTYVRTLQE